MRGFIKGDEMHEAIKWHVRDDLDAARKCSIEDHYFNTEAEAVIFASREWAHKTDAEKRQEGGITVTKEYLHLTDEGRIDEADPWNYEDARIIENVLMLTK